MGFQIGSIQTCGDPYSGIALVSFIPNSSGTSLSRRAYLRNTVSSHLEHCIHEIGIDITSVLDNGPPDATSNSPSTSSSIPVPTQGCQSPNHDQPLVPFTLSQGEGALGGFIGQCQSEFQPGGIDGCTLYYNPCSQDNGAQAIDVILSVQQWTWADGTTSTWPDVQEMNDAISEIMNNCDTTTVTEKWGGFKSVQTANGIRMYNVTANQNGQYPTNTGFGMVSITSGGWDCPDWDST